MIKEFRGEYRWLSNFWPAKFILDDKEWLTTEHYYQANKFTHIPHVVELIRRTESPGKVKSISRNYIERPGWHDTKVDVMFNCVYAKFSQNEDLRKKLVATGICPLQEGNTWNDTFWGVCNGVGENNLGKVLMKVRDMLR